MILGLTGGIASGKSTVSRMLTEYGFVIVDADIGAREVVAKGSSGLKKIRRYFGEQVIQSDGTLNRARLGEEVFADAQKRQMLDQLLEEDIRNWIAYKTEEATEKEGALVVLDIPLLFEAGYDAVVDQTMVVAVSEDTQLERLMERNQLSREEALNRIRSQMPLEEKVNKADIVIDNNGTIEETEQQIKDWLISQGLLQSPSE